MSTTAMPAGEVPQWKEPTKNQWYRLHGGVVRLDALDAFDFTVLADGDLYRAALFNDERADVDYRRFHPDGP